MQPPQTTLEIGQESGLASGVRNHGSVGGNGTRTDSESMAEVNEVRVVVSWWHHVLIHEASEYAPAVVAKIPAVPTRYCHDFSQLCA